MRKRHSERKIIENIVVTDIAEGGKGLGKADDLVVFIDKAVPGDLVDVEVYRKKKNFAEAKITSLKKLSEHRTEAFCQHFGVCGGCKWQHMTYDSQLFFKQKSVTDALQRLGKIDTSMSEPILASAETRFYRNKLEFTFSNKRWLTNTDIQEQDHTDMDALGFHIPTRFDKILDIETCYLQASPSNEIRNKVREFTLREGFSYYDLRNHEGALRNLVIRTASTGEIMVIVIFAYAEESQRNSLLNYLKSEFPQITSLLYIINHKLNDTFFDQEVHVFHGRDHIFERMQDRPGREDLKFKIGPKSFYQTNSDQAAALYRISREYADFQGDELVYDLYTGAGTIANFIARDVKKVVGVEYVEDAILDARINSEINGINNTVFFAGDMKDVLTPAFVSEQGKPDVIIVDPPRAGMHPDVVQRLLEIASPKIVYISCNAATQARDVAMLSEKYQVTKIRPVDMFPHTQHVENIALLILK